MYVDHARDEPPPGAPLAAAVRELAAGFSIEVTPRSARTVDSLAALLPTGCSTYVPHVPGTPYGDVLATCRRLVADGMRPVPHLAARNIASRTQLDERLAALVAAGVDALLLVAGSDGRPAGPFADTQSVLETGLLLHHGLRRLGVAGHPEGHPAAGPAALGRALEAKAAYAAATGSEMWLVTQFAFADRPVVRWLSDLCEAGCRLPVRVGVPGPATPRTLLAYAVRCGVGASARMLLHRPKAVGGLFGHWTPDRLVLGLARHRCSMPESPLAGIHVYPFGGLRRAVAWLEAARGIEASDPDPCPAASTEGGAP